MKEDIKWKHRFSNFEKALSQLQEGIENNGADSINIIKDGIA